MIAIPLQPMFADVLHTFLFSLSPFGEARAGIPLGVLLGLPPFVSFAAGLMGNLLVYPSFSWLINRFNQRLWQQHGYRKHSIRLMRRAKKGVGGQVSKYGFWGLMVFVMIPLPVTGAYMGTIAAKVLNIPNRSALYAISIGVTISSLIMWAVTYWGDFLL